MQPFYLESYKNGTLDRAIESSRKMLESCSICPRKCGVNRLKNERGFCKTGYLPLVYSYMSHQGEEPAISGTNGSGTIFFSNCNMGCVYCQNYEFSQEGRGKETSFEELAKIMLELQNMGAHNINLVTPTHIMPQILESLKLAIKGGLKIPLVYNTSGYESASLIKLLEGIVDIYLTDMRYSDNESAKKFSCAPDYPKHNQEAVKEIFRQVGIAQFDKNDIMKRGLIIRHLVLPNDISGTEKIMKFISEEISDETYISLMSQYLPYYNASKFTEISRRLTKEEYTAAIDSMHKFGLYNGWTQESFGLERFAGVNIKIR